MNFSIHRFHIKLFSSIVLTLFFSSVVVAADCEQPAGSLVSIQGQAEFRSKGESAWRTITEMQKFCPGDMFRTARNSRAAVVLPNETLLRINQKTTLTFPEAIQEKPLLLNILEGVLHIFSHQPRALQVTTPFVNGAVEGTEFLVQVDPARAVITVFTGLVAAVNDQGRLDVSSGQSVIAQKGKAPEYQTVVKPRDAVHWTLYYPVIIESQKDVSQTVRSASDQLTVGLVGEAQETINRVLKKDPTNSEALALQSIIAVVQNNKDQALTTATQAIEANPQSAAAGLALSYAQQAHFDILGALKTLEEASLSNPNNAQVKARLAELYLSVGELDQALSTAQKAVNLNPDIGRTQTVLGFAHLTRIETEQAQEAFRKAISLDQSLPLARLGLGLAMIRDGNLEEGRAEIEIAAALDPNNALIRSYLGKAYFEEKRDDRSARQYETAKALNPSDPTSWFYDAIRKQTVNRPVEALHDLQQSIALNNNRAVYRSQLLLDEDLAARSASLARIYSDLGFQQLALVEGRKSLNTDPGNYSAHRFLADTYTTLPRHEIARVSELLQSQLLQPLNITPVQPQLAESNLGILDGAGPTALTFNEFNPLFLRNKFTLQASGVVGDNDTLGDELVHSGIWNKFSYSIGQYYYASDGFRDNNDQKINIYNAFIQGTLSHKTSVMSEIRYRKKTFGDLGLRFDPIDYSGTIRQDDETESLRLGIKYDIKPGSTLIGTAIISSFEGNAKGIQEFPLSLDINQEADNFMGEIQHLYSGSCFKLTSGAGFLSADETQSTNFISPFVSFIEEETRTEHFNIYSYGHLQLPYNAFLTLGLSGDLLDAEEEDKDELNPKIGISWQPTANTTFRATAFRTLQRRLIYSQTIEPTQVAGFNQFFEDFKASTVWNYGIGLDQSFSPSWYGGIQYMKRDMEVPFPLINPLGLTEQIEDDWEEQIGSAYLYWAPHPWFTLGAEYYYEDYFHEQWEGPQGIQNLTTHRLTPKIHFFHPSGIIAKIQASYIDQEGDFGSTFIGFTQDNDQFWIVDASLGYRLPKRYGIINLEVKNLFDEEFQFLDTDPARPRFFPEMQVIFKVTFNF